MSELETPEPESNGRLRRVVVAAAVLAGVGLLALAFNARGAKETKARVETVPVTTALVSRKTVPVEVRAIGNVEAYNAVSVRSLVAGELTRVHFAQGQDVKKGDLLFTIDTRPLEAALQQAESALARDRAAEKQAEAVAAKDRAQLRNAQAEAARYDKLFTEGITSHELAEQYRTSADAMAAAVQADEASVMTMQANVRSSEATVENARVQLSYAVIRAPIDGKTGNLTVYQGNLVKANDTTPLVTITQATPVYVAFSLPEQELGRLRQAAAGRPLPVVASLPGDDAHSVDGRLTFVDNTVDTTTGTIRLKATFANAERKLWPGQFARVTITLASLPDATVVPSPSVQTGQDGSYVYVVKDDSTVEVRPIKAGATIDQLTVVQKGLAPGETIVTDGQLRLFPGAHVEPKTEGGGGPGEAGKGEAKGRKKA